MAEVATAVVLDSDMSPDASAAIVIQKHARGRQARKNAKAKRKGKSKKKKAKEMTKDEAATRIQKHVRGKRARKRAKAKQQEKIAQKNNLMIKLMLAAFMVVFGVLLAMFMGSDCPAGLTDADHDANTPCQVCGAGDYSLPGSVGPCKECPAGRFGGGAGFISCEACREGQYAGAGSTSCDYCAAGTADKDKDAATECSPCSPGTYAGCGETTCKACAPGQVDADLDASTPCTPCAPGQFWTTADAARNSSGYGRVCVQCAAGQADLDEDSATECSACAEGEYSPVGAVACVACADTGQFDHDLDPSTPCSDTNICRQACPAGKQDEDCDVATPCTSCAAGTYGAGGDAYPEHACSSCPAGRTDEDGDPSTPCATCEPGFYATAALSGACLSCPAGTFAAASETESLEECEACQEGQFAANGSAVCTFCASGRADLDQDPSTDCEECRAGTYSGCGETACNDCEAGQVDHDSLSTTPCQACLPGQYYWTEEGAATSSCIQCEAGRADEDVDSTTPCAECGLDTFSPAGSVQCTACAPGFADEDARADTPCVGCRAGQFWRERVGNTSLCTDCPAGKADSDLDSTTSCSDCSDGSYASSASTSCVLCADTGQFDHDLDPATPCSDTNICRQPCHAGQHDHDCDVGTPCVACPAGGFAPGGELLEDNTADTPCDRCLAGQSDFDSDSATACTDCAAGTFSADGLAGPCTSCTAGKYAGIASSACANCTAGTVDDDSDAATPCVDCLPGTFSQEGTSIACTDCPDGRFSAAARATSADDCSGCLPGQYAASGAEVCAFCQSGRADEDMDAATECTACSVGKYAGCGETLCNDCVPGQVDTDENSATPCTDCVPGQFWVADNITGVSSCIQCQAGKADLDEESITACSACAEGEYAPIGAVVCTLCAASNQFDDDLDPSTPCSDTDICRQNCSAGTQDADCNEDTACTSCAAGKYTAGGLYPERGCEDCEAGKTDEDGDPSTPCVTCGPGFYATAALSGACPSCPAGTFAAASGSPEIEACEACQGGQYSGEGSARCTFCDSGRADTDDDPATGCEDCSAGTYAGCGETICNVCEAGQVDHDLDPTTPCQDCLPGQVWLEGEGETISSCVQCEAGRADLDLDSTTPCAECGQGNFSAAGSFECRNCVASGLVDHDLDASTPCIAQGLLCSQQCNPGFVDDDCDPTTACTACQQGQYSTGGAFTEQSSCIACNPGSYGAQGSPASECVGCSPGTADTDGDTWTPCQECEAGKFTADIDTQVFALENATACHECLTGKFDHDGDGATPCQDCEAGKNNPRTGSTDSTDCDDCDAGRWSDRGSNACAACPIGFYRAANDQDGCMQCDYDAGEVCNSAGMFFARAAAGFYADAYVSSATGMNTTRLVECLPWQACLGRCDAKVQQELLLQEDASATRETMESCDGSLGKDACTEGYQGIRCSLCKPFESGQGSGCEEDADGIAIPNGYYRVNQRCEPCPCTWLTFEVMIFLFVLLLLAALFLLDSFSADFSEHASVMVGPSIILLTFCQTVSLSLDIDIPWPPVLRRCIQWLDTFNFDLEVGRPECTFSYGPVEKMNLVAATPVIVFGTLCLYTFLKYIDIYCIGDSRNHRTKEYTAKQLHQIATTFLFRKAVTVGGSFFVVFSITFVRNALRPFHCLANSDDASKTFMMSAPDVECSVGPDGTYEDERYAKIRYTAWWCLVIYFLVWFVVTGFLVAAGMSKNPGLGYMGFMGDKYEKRFFFWEMVIVARKLALMAVFLLNTFEFAWLFGSFVLIVAVVLQAGARPYEDKFTDWAEFLTLVANLLILQTGPLFKLLAETGTREESTTGLRTSVEATAVALMFAAVGYSAAAQRHVLFATRRSVDYKEMMVEERLNDAKQAVTRLEARQIELRETHRRLREEEQISTEEGVNIIPGKGASKKLKRAFSSSGRKKLQRGPSEMSFGNPLHPQEGQPPGDDDDGNRSPGGRKKLIEGDVVQIVEGHHCLPLRVHPKRGANHAFTWEEGEEHATVMELRKIKDEKLGHDVKWMRLRVNDKQMHMGWGVVEHRHTLAPFVEVVERGAPPFEFEGDGAVDPTA